MSAHSLVRILAQKRGIDQAVTAVADELKKLSKSKITGNEITKAGAISSNADEAIGEIIADAMDEAGKESVTTVERGKSLDNELQVVEIVEGLNCDRCHLSRYFISNPERQMIGLEESYIEKNQTDQIQSIEYKSRISIYSSSTNPLLAELPAAEQ